MICSHCRQDREPDPSPPIATVPICVSCAPEQRLFLEWMLAKGYTVFAREDGRLRYRCPEGHDHHASILDGTVPALSSTVIAVLAGASDASA